MSIRALSPSSLRLNRAQTQLEIITRSRNTRASSSDLRKSAQPAKPVKKFVIEELGPGDLAGTVRHHENYVILQHPLRPTEQPHGISSPLLKKVKTIIGDKTAVNVGWTSDVWTIEEEGTKKQQGDKSEPRSGRWLNALLQSNDVSKYAGIKGKELVDMSIYSSRHPWTSRAFSFDPEAVDGALDSIEEALHTWASDMELLRESAEFRETTPGEGVNTHPIDIFICTHGQRDCRCGEAGTAFADALKDEVRKRREAARKNESSASRKIPIRIGELTHVGRHDLAANALVFPWGDWYGLLQPSDAAKFLDALVTWRSNITDLTVQHETKPLDIPAPFSLLRHWRGRMGMSAEEQNELARLGSSNGR